MDGKKANLNSGLSYSVTEMISYHWVSVSLLVKVRCEALRTWSGAEAMCLISEYGLQEIFSAT